MQYCFEVSFVMYHNLDGGLNKLVKKDKLREAAWNLNIHFDANINRRYFCLLSN